MIKPIETKTDETEEPEVNEEDIEKPEEEEEDLDKLEEQAQEKAVEKQTRTIKKQISQAEKEIEWEREAKSKIKHMLSENQMLARELFKMYSEMLKTKNPFEKMLITNELCISSLNLIDRVKQETKEKEMRKHMEAKLKFFNEIYLGIETEKEITVKLTDKIPEDRLKAYAKAMGGRVEDGTIIYSEKTKAEGLPEIIAKYHGLKLLFDVRNIDDVDAKQKIIKQFTIEQKNYLKIVYFVFEQTHVFTGVVQEKDE